MSSLGSRSAPTTPTSEQVLELANAVSEDRFVQLLAVNDAGSKIQVGWSPIADAVVGGSAFMVKVRPGVLALDADDVDRVAALQGIAHEMRHAGLTPVVIDSGRGQHLWVRVPERETYWADRAGAAGIDVRSAGRSIRPPLSPHPEGHQVLLRGISYADAVAALRAPTVSGRAKSLSPDMLALLIEGHPSDGRYKSLSETVQAVATACVNAGLSRSWFLAALQDPANRLAREFSQRRDPKRRLVRSWDAAVAHVEQHPPRSRAPSAMFVIEATTRWVATLPPSARAVMAAHMKAAQHVGSARHVLSVPDCAVMAGLSPGTVRTCRRLLIEIGLLAEVEKGNGKRAGCWDLMIPRCPEPTLDAEEHSAAYIGANPLTTDFGLDAYRWGALGKWGAEVVAALRSHDGPLTVNGFHAMLPNGPSKSTLRRILNKAANENVTVKAEDGWLLVNDSAAGLDRVAEASGRLGIRQAAIERMKADQAQRREERRRFAERGFASG